MDTKDTKESPIILTFVSLVSFVLNSTRDTKICNPLYFSPTPVTVASNSKNSRFRAELIVQLTGTL